MAAFRHATLPYAWPGNLCYATSMAATRLTLCALGLLLPLGAWAAATGPELYISPRGEVRISGAELKDKNALNLFSLTVWGQKWTIPIDQFTMLESADGKKIQLDEILLGHLLEIKGYAAGQKPGWLDTRLVRDLSLGPPPPPAPAQSAAAAGANVLPPPPAFPPPALTPPPPPATGLKTPRTRLTQQLRAGMRGGEVVVLQEFLQKGGWGIPDNGPVTGYFGKVTVQAVKKFQVASGLPPEGEVGPRTRALMNALLE